MNLRDPFDQTYVTRGTAGCLLEKAFQSTRVDKNDDALYVDAVKVLRNLGIEFGYLADEEPCCGGLLHYIGLEKEFNNNSQ